MSTDISTREGLFAVMRQIAAERAAAKPLVAELMQRAEPPWDEEIPEEWKTAGFVDELTKAAAAILEKDPEKTVSFLHFAFALASGGMPHDPSSVVSHISGVCLKHAAFAHQFRGSLDEAARLIKVAIRILDDAGLRHESTNARFVQAGIIMRLRRVDESLRLLEQCEVSYRAFGDRPRLIRCQILRGGLAGIRGDCLTGIECISQVIDEADEIEDAYTRIIAHTNLGVAYKGAGQKAKALQHLSHAHELSISASMPVMQDRIEWIQISVMIDEADSEKFPSALAELTRLRGSFLDRGMIDDAGLAGLDIVDLLVALERREEARELAERVMAEFAYPGLENFAARAAAYLRDLIPASENARAAVRHVKSYVLRTRAELLVEPFAPLDDK